MSASATSPAYVEALLRWYRDSGLDTIEADQPTDFADWPTVSSPLLLSRSAPRAVASPAAPSAAPSPVAAPSAAGEDSLPTDEAVAAARRLAEGATSVEELAAAIAGFEDCPLKAAARNTVVFDGVPRAALLVIGEAPGRDEDAAGKPFVGRAGQLLDRMLGAIGVSRQTGDGLADACITNAIYWRPPGNRTPTKAEVAICLPFLTRFIALSSPKVILLTGNAPNQALFPGAPGIMRSRGQWREWDTPEGPVPVVPVFHPAFLLRQPQHKRLAWADLKEVAQRLHSRS